MRCDDCLPLIEEYFDGEVEETTSARMGAHLSACATCAAALDALSFEQEIYARYDRGGLEVTPDLWARVSAEIARDARPAARPTAQRPFLSRVREQLAAYAGTFTARPALASSLALLLVGVAVGSLWLARRAPSVNTPELAETNAPTPRVSVNPTVPAEGGVDVPEQNPGSSNVTEPVVSRETEGSYEMGVTTSAGAREVANGTRPVTIGPLVVATEDDVMRLLASPSAPPANPNIVVIGRAEEHDAPEDETVSLFVNTSAPAGDTSAGSAGSARLLDPAAKEVARHVEQTQMLLRSIKNARASEAGAVDVAYEKNLSRKLLAQNATLQLEAEVKGDKETKQVLDTIEPFLLDIANLRENPSREEVRSIRERVKQNEIVAALQVY